jgi:hypothetical protein
MEDIICPECGRPNLFEAEKCWYCQIDLQDIKRNEMESHSTESINGDISQDKAEISNSTEESEQFIPEWLKRVRELKEADQPPEENDPSWEQQHLFEIENNDFIGKKTINKKPSPKKKVKIEKKNDNPADLAEQKPYVYQKKDTTEIQEIVETEPTDQEDDALSHDLPEGFTKI